MSTSTAGHVAQRHLSLPHWRQRAHQAPERRRRQQQLVDETAIYFTQGPQGVYWIPIEGMVAAKTLFAGFATRLIAVDDTFVYAATIASTGADTDIFKLVK